MQANSISIVIRARNSEKTLERVLEAIGRQSLQPLEIIVVDNGSIDGTVVIAQQFGCKVIPYPEQYKFNYSKALNIGFAAASGTYCMSLSAHSILVDSRTIQLLSQALGSPCVCGSYSARGNEGGSDESIPPHFETVSLLNFNGFNALENPCSMIRRSDWEMRPFDEGLPCAEDMHWAVWMYKHTKRVTIRITYPVYLYANQNRSLWKPVSETVWVAHTLEPNLFKIGYIRQRLWKASSAMLKGRFSVAQREFVIALALGPFRRQVLHEIGERNKIK